MATANPPFKRYCKVLTLKNDPELIEEYQQVHAMGAVWQEIIDGMKALGILDMEIYLHGNQLFMIMDTVADFDHDKAMATLGTLPRQTEWEAFVSKFQNTDENASAKDKWQLIPRIFELEQKEVYRAGEGQLKILK